MRVGFHPSTLSQLALSRKHFKMFMPYMFPCIWQFCQLVTLFLGMVSERVHVTPKSLGWVPGDLTGEKHDFRKLKPHQACLQGDKLQEWGKKKTCCIPEKKTGYSK